MATEGYDDKAETGPQTKKSIVEAISPLQVAPPFRSLCSCIERKMMTLQVGEV